MPIYEYQCTHCGAVVEVLQRMHDKPLKTCESCGGGLEKLISRSSFRLKGSGWYVSDYARKGKKDGESEGSSSSGSSSKSGSATSGSTTSGSATSGSTTSGSSSPSGSSSSGDSGGSKKSGS